MKLRKDKWEIKKLAEIASIIMGQSPPSNTYNNEGKGLPFFQGKTEFTDKHPRTAKWCSIPIKIAEPKDILITVRAPVGATNIANQKCCIGRGISAIRSTQNNDFILYFLQSVEKELSLKGTGTIFGGISGKILSNLEIPLPSLEEQKQIASLFQSIETAIENVEGQEKNLLRLKNNLLRDLFSNTKKFGDHLKNTDFETVRFDKVAINISERVEPKNTSLTTYVGLEHLDADNLKIERTGIPDDVIGTKLKIYKGDIIFGKRRAYLRKLAVSHFDGIASAHSMILRANEKNIEKEFLPYFMQSDTFMSRAVQISEGSLSPTIKSRTLAQQEFTLPKKEKQPALIKVFKQFDITIDRLKQQKTTLKNLKQKLLNEILG
ncbi:MAG: restriction endonuclease subunit S [Bacteroidetes bacterium]|nr:restriction endonuclease subunit S [Bacteroidota bacterium]